jgi:hypothetical protein
MSHYLGKGGNEAPKENPKTPTPKPSQNNSMHHKMPFVTKTSIATESDKKGLTST